MALEGPAKLCHLALSMAQPFVTKTVDGQIAFCVAFGLFFVVFLCFLRIKTEQRFQGTEA